MKTWIGMATAVMIFTGTLATAQAAETSGDAYAGVYNMYLWRGMDLSPDADYVVQPGVDVSVGGFAAGFWANYDENLETVNEVDIVLDYSTDIGEMVSLSVGNIYYALEGIEDTNELYAGLALNTLLSPTFTLYWDYDEAEEAGLFGTLGISHGFDVNERLSLGLGALASFNIESDYAVGDYSALHNGELSATVDYALSDLLSISALGVFSTPLSDEAEEEAVVPLDDEFLFGVSLALAF